MTDSHDTRAGLEQAAPRQPGPGLNVAIGESAADAPHPPAPGATRKLRRAVLTAHRQSRAGAAMPLSRTVRQLQQALSRAHQKRLDAEQSLERQAAFMAVLAHELRAPLSPIRTAAALLGGATCSPETNAFVGSLLERQTAHAARLVDDLLDVARIRSGKLQLQRGVVDLGQVVAGAAETCRPSMLARAQTLHIDLASQPLWVDADAVRLAQILNNLLANASRYTPRGGVITLAVRSAEGRASVVVGDNGIGLAPQDLQRIFDPYFQQALAVSYDASGIGLGLSVVRELVLAHGGRISVRSDGPGCGSQFEMSLALLQVPSLAADGGAGAATGSAADHSAGRSRVRGDLPGCSR